MKTITLRLGVLFCSLIISTLNYSQNLEVEGGAIIDGTTLNVDADNNRVVIGDSTTSNKFEVFVDSLFIVDTLNDQSAIALGEPLTISSTVFAGQSFVVDTTGLLTRIEVMAKSDTGDDSELTLELRTGNDPALGSSVIIENFVVANESFEIYSIVFANPVQVKKGDLLVIIIKIFGGDDAVWERSNTDVYAGGTAFLNASGWLPPLLTKDHWFKSYIELQDSSIVPVLSVSSNLNVGIGTSTPGSKVGVKPAAI